MMIRVVLVIAAILIVSCSTKIPSEHITLIIENCNKNKECIMREATKQIINTNYTKNYKVCLIIDTGEYIDKEEIIWFTCFDKTTNEIKEIALNK